MKYATKLPIKPDVPYLHKATVVLGRHGIGLNDFAGRVIRKYLPKKQIEIVKDALPKSLLPFVLGVNFTEVRLLAAHVHVVERSVINFYQQTNGEITKFFEGSVEPDDQWSTDNGNGYLNVDMDQLQEAEAFIAQDQDVWLLDALQPHSVEIIGDTREGMMKFDLPNGNKRTMVQVYLDLPYDEAVKHFEGMLDAA